MTRQSKAPSRKKTKMNFGTLREKLEEKKSEIPTSEKKVFNKRIKGVRVVITKGSEGFTAFIDGEKLDTYRNQREAERMASEFVNEL